MEEKYRSAMFSNAQLQREKLALLYEAEALQEDLSSLEELLWEARRHAQNLLEEREQERQRSSALQLQLQKVEETLRRTEKLLEEASQVRCGPQKASDTQGKEKRRKEREVPPRWGSRRSNGSATTLPTSQARKSRNKAKAEVSAERCCTQKDRKELSSKTTSPSGEGEPPAAHPVQDRPVLPVPRASTGNRSKLIPPKRAKDIIMDHKSRWNPLKDKDHLPAADQKVGKVVSDRKQSGPRRPPEDPDHSSQQRSSGGGPTPPDDTQQTDEKVQELIGDKAETSHVQTEGCGLTLGGGGEANPTYTSSNFSEGSDQGCGLASLRSAVENLTDQREALHTADDGNISSNHELSRATQTPTGTTSDVSCDVTVMDSISDNVLEAEQSQFAPSSFEEMVFDDCYFGRYIRSGSISSSEVPSEKERITSAGLQHQGPCPNSKAPKLKKKHQRTLISCCAVSQSSKVRKLFRKTATELKMMVVPELAVKKPQKSVELEDVPSDTDSCEEVGEET